MKGSPLRLPPFDADDLLAQFTDQALSGDQLLPEQVQNDPDLRSAAEVILRLHTAFSDVEIRPDKAEQMLKNLIAVWRQSHSKQTQSKAWIRQVSQMIFPNAGWQSRQSRQRWSLAIVMIGVSLILILAFPFILQGATATPASAGWLPVAIGALVVTVILAVVALLWNDRKP